MRVPQLPKDRVHDLATGEQRDESDIVRDALALVFSSTTPVPVSQVHRPRPGGLSGSHHGGRHMRDRARAL